MKQAIPKIQYDLNNQSFYDFFDHMNIGLIVCRTDGTFLKINRPFCNLSAYSHDVLEGISIQQLLHPGIWKRSMFLIQKMIDSKSESTPQKAKLYRSNGETIDVEIHASPVTFSNEHAIQFIIRDLNGSLKEKNRIQKWEKWFIEIMSDVHLVSLILDSKANISFCNQYLLDLTGYHFDEVAGKNWFKSFIPVERRKEIRTVFKEGFHSKTIKTHYVNEIRTKEGKRLFISWSNTYLRNGTDKITGVACIGENITEYKQSEEALVLERDRFMKLAASSPGVLFTFKMRPDGSQLIPYASPQLIDIMGFHPEELAQNAYPLLSLIHEADSERMVKSIINSAREVETWRQEFRYEHPTKGVIWIEGHSMPMHDPDGSTIWHGFLTDITDRKKAEEALRESEKQYRELIDGMNETVWVIDTNGDLIDANKRALEVLGYTKEELLAIGIYGIDSSLKKEDIKALAAAMPKDTLQIFETSHKTKAGRSFPVEIYSSLVTYQGKEAILSIVRDITERKQAEQALISKNKEYQALSKQYKALNDELAHSLEQVKNTNVQFEIAKEKAEESDRLKSIFLSNMSHEVRTPLNAIMGFAGLIDSISLSESKRNKYINIIQNSGKRLTQLINDIIDISKIESKQFSIKLREHYLYKIIENSIHIFDKSNLLINKPDIKMIYNFPDDFKKIIVSTDEVRLQQVLDNLISNAIKYTEKGNVEIGLVVHDEKKDKEIEIYVKDTGIGIPEEKHAVIFQRFRQVEENGFHEGTGLGLSISKGIIHLLGGKIWFSSKLNVGTTFHISIPASETKEISDNRKKQKVPPVKLDYKTIIIAEDDYHSFALLREIFKSFKADIIHAENGMILMELLEKIAPDLILLDINMPEKTGMQCIKEIRDKGLKYKVICQTAFAMVGEKEKWLNAGCDGYISKPINKDELFELIAKVMTEN